MRFKKKERLRSLEVVLNAIINLLHKKDMVRREEIQLQILDDQQEERVCGSCGSSNLTFNHKADFKDDELYSYDECDDCGHRNM